MANRSSAASVVVVVLSLCLCSSSPSSAAPPRDELLRLVPDDAGFCAVVQDLRDNLDRLNRSPFARQFAAGKIGQALANSPELRKFAALDGQLRTLLNVSWDRLRDDILGDAVVLAYAPGPPDKPEQEQGLLLVHARQPDLLAGLLDRLNGLQKTSGELAALESRTHLGQTYYRRTKAKGGDEFYYLRGPVLAFSDKEARLKQVVERDRQQPPADAVVPPLTRRLEALGVERSLAVWWINPEAFAPALRQKVEKADGAEATFLTAFARYWAALDGVALFLNVEREFSVGVAARTRAEALPAAARKALGEAAVPSALLTSFPDTALFVATGRVPLGPLVESGAEFLTPEGRQHVRDALAKSVGAVLGKDVLPQLLQRLGPDWGVCVTPPDPADRTWLPSLTAVLRLQGGDGLPVERRVLDGLDFVARLCMVAHNSRNADQIRYLTVQQGPVEVRYLESDQGFPPGLRPSFAWKGGYLVLATSPESVQRFNPPTAEPPATSAEVPLVRVALQGWAGYLRAYREPLTAYLADAHKVPRADVQNRIDGLLEGLEPFDVLELTQRAGPGQATLTLRLRTLAPLQADPPEGTKKPH